MRIFLVVKQVGKKRDALDMVPMEISEGEWTLSHLIDHIVRANVRRYNEKQVDADVVRYLMPTAIDEQADVGKVGFGRRYAKQDAEPDTAVEAALLAFSDGLYRVFVDDVEAARLEEVLPLKEGTRVTFVRLTFLAGRMW